MFSLAAGKYLNNVLVDLIGDGSLLLWARPCESIKSPAMDAWIMSSPSLRIIYRTFVSYGDRTWATALLPFAGR